MEDQRMCVSYTHVCELHSCHAECIVLENFDMHAILGTHDQPCWPKLVQNSSLAFIPSAGRCHHHWGPGYVGDSAGCLLFVQPRLRNLPCNSVRMLKQQQQQMAVALAL